MLYFHPQNRICSQVISAALACHCQLTPYRFRILPIMLQDSLLIYVARLVLPPPVSLDHSLGNLARGSHVAPSHHRRRTENGRQPRLCYSGYPWLFRTNREALFWVALSGIRYAPPLHICCQKNNAVLGARGIQPGDSLYGRSALLPGCDYNACFTDGS